MYLEEHAPRKANGARTLFVEERFVVNRFVLCRHVFTSNCFQCLFVYSSHVAENAIQPSFHRFIPAEQTSSAGRVVEIRFHLVIAQLVHDQYQDLPSVRSTRQILRQNWSETAVIVVPLQSRQFGLGITMVHTPHVHLYVRR